MNTATTWPSPVLSIQPNPAQTTGLPTHHRAASRLSRLIDMTASAALTLTATTNLIDVHGSPVSWLATVVPAIIVALAATTALAAPTPHPARILGLLITGQVLIGPLLMAIMPTPYGITFAPEHVLRHISHIFSCFTSMLATDPPVGNTDDALLAAWSITLWGCALTMLCAQHIHGSHRPLPSDSQPSASASNTSTPSASPAYRAHPASALLALLTVASHALCALLGTHTGYHRSLSGAIAAVILIGWCAYKHRRIDHTRWLSIIMITGIAFTTALSACHLVSQHRFIAREHYDAPWHAREQTSPLSRMRAYRKHHQDDALLTVHGLPEQTPIRLAVMDHFDGNIWSISSTAPSSTYRRTPPTGDATPASSSFDTTLQRSATLDPWLPLAGIPTHVDVPSCTLYYNTQTRTAICERPAGEAVRYRLQGSTAPHLSPQQFDNAAATSLSSDELDHIPRSVRELATSIAAGQRTAGAQARTLAQWLHEHGWFSHGMEGDYPSAPGHGEYRIESMLGEGIMVGDSEQYASAMALMARSLGIPSRVVVGFAPYEHDDVIHESESDETERADIDNHAGSPKRVTPTTPADANNVSPDVRVFTGEDINAWVEVNLRDYGWVPLFPTPDDDRRPQDDNLRSTNPDPAVRQPPTPLHNPSNETPATPRHTTIHGTNATAPNHTWHIPWHMLATIAAYTAPLWGTALIVGILVTMPLVYACVARRKGHTRKCIASAWLLLVITAQQHHTWATGNITRRQQAQRIARCFEAGAQERDLLMRLAREADEAAFGPDVWNTRRVQTYWNTVMRLRRFLFARLGFVQRWRARLRAHVMIRALAYARHAPHSPT